MEILADKNGEPLLEQVLRKQEGGEKECEEK